MALARHGNFFHWGFAASPAYMTDEAKPLLANAIVYISKFAGQTPIARKYDDRISTRSYIADRKEFVSRASYENYAKSLEDFNKATLERQADVQRRVDAGEDVPENELFYLNARLEEIPTYEQYLQMQAPI